MARFKLHEDFDEDQPDAPQIRRYRNISRPFEGAP